MFGEGRKKSEVVTRSVFTAPHGCWDANLLICTVGEYIYLKTQQLVLQRDGDVKVERGHEIREVRISEDQRESVP